jgi:3'(2'), 5'-bisphosphate nucleotidase
MYTQRPMSEKVLLEVMTNAAVAAGGAAFEVYQGHFDVQLKADDSPVTAADHAAERIILECLGREAPELPIIAEEQVALGRVPEHGRTFLLVDPLDGTREFIKRNGEFTVNIALVRDGSAVLGVVYAPAISTLFAGNALTGEAWRSSQKPGGAAAIREAIKVRAVPPRGITAVASRSHRSPETDAYLAGYSVAEMVSIGSSLKFCKVAAGEADLYPRLGTTMEWDTAAGQAILIAAGGRVLTGERVTLKYGKPEYRNPWFVAAGSVEILPLDAPSGAKS